jgi:transposase-like protein
MATAITAPYFHDDDKAREYLESVRWPNGPACPHCGTEGGWTIESKATSKNKVRPGLYKCVAPKDCGKQFSVTVGTVFERSKIPLSKWLFAAYLICSSKKGISSHQLHRTLGVTYKTAWFLTHRIRHAMDSSGGLLGSDGGIVEGDEAFIGRGPGAKKGRYPGKRKQNTILALVERNGEVRSTVVTNFTQIKRAFKKHVSPDANLMTDEHKKFRKIGKQFVSHETVNHGRKEYARGNVNTNTIEGVFSIFKRGMTGVYQHCGKQHLHRYLAEFDFRYNHRSALGIEDSQRMNDALAGIEGKRLTYR